MYTFPILELLMNNSISVHHVGTRDLRANLAHHLRAAEAGHTIFVTVDGKVVAQLGPVSGLVEAPSNSIRQGPQAVFDLPAGLSSERALREIRGR